MAQLDPVRLYAPSVAHLTLHARGCDLACASWSDRLYCSSHPRAERARDQALRRESGSSPAATQTQAYTRAASVSASAAATAVLLNSCEQLRRKDGVLLWQLLLLTSARVCARVCAACAYGGVRGADALAHARTHGHPSTVCASVRVQHARAAGRPARAGSPAPRTGRHVVAARVHVLRHRLWRARHRAARDAARHCQARARPAAGARV